MTTTTGIGVHDQNLERQIEKHMSGCMAGFFNLFDRSHLLAGKRLPPRISSSVVSDSSYEPASLVGSPSTQSDFKKAQSHVQRPQASPKSELRSPAVDPGDGKPPKPPSPFEFKEAVRSPWKFSREAPRLSLDSRAIVDAKGCLHPREIRINTVTSAGDGDDERDNQRRSPSVIARLMGLEPVAPNPSSLSSVSEVEKKVELRRSASESRSRDYRFFDASNFFSPKCEISGERKLDPSLDNRNPNYTNNMVMYNISNPNAKNQNQIHKRNQRRVMAEKKSYYDTTDFFPPEKYQNQHHQQQAVTIYGEIERRLRMRGIDGPSKDLETLKHILEALQLKGLLHSSTVASNPHHNLVSDRRSFDEEESPIVLMKPARTTTPGTRRGRPISGDPSVSPRRETPVRALLERAKNRSSGPTVRRKGAPLSTERQRRGGETTTLRGSHSPAQSPKKARPSSSNQTVNRSLRGRRSTVETSQREKERVLSGPEDEASTVSESSFSTSLHTDNERWRVEEYRNGRNLLERCDKLLHSIAEMTSNSNSTLLPKPSPVSVLDSSFYKEDESSPSPVKKCTIDFQDQVVMELEDDEWSPPSSSWSSTRTQFLSPKLPDHHHHDTDSTSEGSDFSYVSEVLRASSSSVYPSLETDLFLLLEKHSSSKDKSKPSIIQRKLIFDTITEILDRACHLPPWKAVLGLGRPTADQIWAEFQKIQQRGPAQDLLEVIGGVLKKDLAGDSVNGWCDCHVEMSEAVLDIERLIYKDLISEIIRDVVIFAGKCSAPRRRLIF